MSRSIATGRVTRYGTKDRAIDSVFDRCQISRMSNEIDNLSRAGRRAIAQQDWTTVRVCANGILGREPRSAEGHHLLGIAEKAAKRPRLAIDAFETALAIDSRRYDAAIELASQYSMARRNGDAQDILARYTSLLDNSPMYLDMAGTVYTEIGLAEKAWPLFQKACELQPDIPVFLANLATCAVYVGEIDVAKDAYRKLLVANPQHQRNHYHLSRLSRATDTSHIDEMLKVLSSTNLPPDRNIFLFYALGKEYEDLERWNEAFEWYKQGGDAASSIANYDTSEDISIIDKVIEICDARWLRRGSVSGDGRHRPQFIVGLPRTGTTLTERILASHSNVMSVGETEFIQMMIRKESGVSSNRRMTPEMLDAVEGADIRFLRDGYLDQVRYRLGDEPVFIDKLPFNILYLGFIAKAWPEQPIVLLNRNPMDACFSMYKQVFTWAYKFSYSLETLADYYIAYDRLCRHWREVLGDRLIDVHYEELVTDLEGQTRRLLDRLGLEFEPACLDFTQNQAPSTTASSVQVRRQIHTDSVARWRRFEKQLEPLRARLEAAGIEVD